MQGAGKLDRQEEEFLVGYAMDKALEEFCRMNQYYSFDAKAKNALRKIYEELLNGIQANQGSVDEIARNHYGKLKNWLKESNPFSEKVYEHAESTVEPVACAEYSPELQLRILHLDVTSLAPPVLDIGCGKQGQLVNYLNSLGIEATGIDRFPFDQPALLTADWLEFDFGVKKWGTITSHLGFSNHFIHHNLREDGNFIGYGQTYMNILDALVTGGCFHYAPDLPFIEKYLDPLLFELKKFNVSNYNYMAAVVKRLA
jgi:hypothetical protein